MPGLYVLNLINARPLDEMRKMPLSRALASHTSRTLAPVSALVATTYERVSDCVSVGR